MSPIVSLAVIVSAALCFIALERRFPYAPSQRFLREGFTLDLVWYTLIQSYLLGQVISWGITWLDTHSGWSRARLVGAWPLWGQMLFFFLVHDIYIYLFHRAQHRFAILWRTHEAHHSGRDVDWLSGSRSHPVEILINQTIEFAPIVLLGAAPEVAAFKGVLDAVWGMYIHSNIDVRAGKWQRVFNGPEMHRWHHAPELAVPGRNFATKLALWDWIFGTAYLPASKPSGYGLVSADDAAFPHGREQLPGVRQQLRSLMSAAGVYVHQVVFAFRPLNGFTIARPPRAAQPHDLKPES
jgi:sterol desaturase/sphingolipid hydroxylase (fatty acid hydroxylase superfamily)